MHGQPQEQKDILRTIHYPLFSKAISFPDKARLVDWAEKNERLINKDVLTHFAHIFLQRSDFYKEEPDALDPENAAEMVAWCLEKGADPFRYVSVEPDLSDPSSNATPKPLLFRANQKPCFDLIIQCYADPKAALNTKIWYGHSYKTPALTFSSFSHVNNEVLVSMLNLGLEVTEDLMQSLSQGGAWEAIEILWDRKITPYHLDVKRQKQACDDGQATSEYKEENPLIQPNQTLLFEHFLSFIGKEQNNIFYQSAFDQFQHGKDVDSANLTSKDAAKLRVFKSIITEEFSEIRNKIETDPSFKPMASLINTFLFDHLFQFDLPYARNKHDLASALLNLDYIAAAEGKNIDLLFHRQNKIADMLMEHHQINGIQYALANLSRGNTFKPALIRESKKGLLELVKKGYAVEGAFEVRNDAIKKFKELIEDVSYFPDTREEYARLLLDLGVHPQIDGMTGKITQDPSNWIKHPLFDQAREELMLQKESKEARQRSEIQAITDRSVSPSSPRLFRRT